MGFGISSIFYIKTGVKKFVSKASGESGSYKEDKNSTLEMYPFFLKRNQTAPINGT